MRVPLSWLNDFVDLHDQTVQGVSDLLTFSGVEVEAIESSGTVLDEHFVVGEVLACEPHPNSDHLHVCKVSDGKETLQIVCGAPNVRTGVKAPLAKIGAVMPGPEGFTIKKGKLRGVESFGMLCSKDELGLGGAHDGIWELPQEAVTGGSVQPFMPPADTVYDLEVTWNRPDCLSVRGIARELAALLGRELKQPELGYLEAGEPVEKLAKVTVKAPKECPRYTARVVTGLDPKAPTPDWMASRLEQCGQRSLGLAVDVTNYVMLELGQPLHAFDRATLKGGEIIVRLAGEGEKIRTLDGVERTLDPSMLVIADAERATAVAGIMGGEETEIEGETGTVLVESALFDPASVKFTATKLGLASESSYRYARGVGKDLADEASRRAVFLLVKYGGATAAEGVIDVDNRDPKPIDVPLSYQRVREVIGIDIAPEKVDAILTSLGIEKVAGDDVTAVFRSPSWRYDLTCDADLIEEVTRMNGLEAIPTQLPTLSAVSQLPEVSYRPKTAVRHALLALDFTEAMHYSFLSKGELDAFDPTSAEKRLEIPNPVSADYGVLRDSLLPQLIGSLGRNASRQVENCALFEIGRVFGKDAKNGTPVEHERVSLGMMGPFGRDLLSKRAPVRDEEALLWLKGAVEALCERLHAPRFSFFACNHPAFAPGFAVEICLGRKRVGLMGAVSATMRHKYRLNTPLVVAELDLEQLVKGLDALPRLKPVPQFPASRKDIAFIAPDSLTHDTVVKTIRKSAPAELTDVTLFDIFTSKAIGAGKRSMGYSLEFRSAERTLKDAEVNAAFAKIAEALQKELGVEIREG